MDNIASQRVIMANGGVLVERFTKPESSGGGAALRFEVDLAGLATTPRVDPGQG